MLTLLARQLERSYGKNAPGTVDPRVLWQEIEAVTAAERFDGRRAHWSLAWQATCKGKAKGWASGDQSMRWLTDDMSEALRADVTDWLQMPGNRKPEVWTTGQASFLPKSKSGEAEAYRPIVPSEPVLGVPSRFPHRTHPYGTVDRR